MICLDTSALAELVDLCPLTDRPERPDVRGSDYSPMTA